MTEVSALPPVHVIVPDAVAERPGFGAVAARLREVCGEALALQLRVRRLPARRVYKLAVGLTTSARKEGGWCVLNERVDIALAAEAQAVQLGRGALSASRARRLLPPGVVVGASVHGAQEAASAGRDGADYAIMGSMYPTGTHRGERPAGLAALTAAVAAGGGIPIVAIGGITAARVSAVREAGGSGVAVIRAVWEAPDPAEAARAIVGAWMAAGDG